MLAFVHGLSGSSRWFGDVVPLLEGRDARLDRVRETLRSAPAARKFFDPACDWAPLGDFDYCTDVDRFDFVLRLERPADGAPHLSRIPRHGVTSGR